MVSLSIKITPEFRGPGLWRFDIRLLQIFLSLKKRKAQANVLSQAFDDDGSLTSDSKRILELTCDFYDRLYSETPHTAAPVEDFGWEALDIPKISDEQKEHLDGKFTEKEFHHVLSCLNKGRCPGSEGLTVEFYLKFWQ